MCGGLDARCCPGGPLMTAATPGAGANAVAPPLQRLPAKHTADCGVRRFGRQRGVEIALARTLEVIDPVAVVVDTVDDQHGLAAPDTPRHGLRSRDHPVVADPSVRGHREPLDGQNTLRAG